MSSISRPAHVLKREKTLTIPRYFIFFDTETTQYVNSDKSISQLLKMGWACYYSRAYGRHRERIDWFYFESADTFWEFVYRHTESKQRLWVISRNIAFDFTVVEGFRFLNAAGYKLRFFHNNGTSAIISVVNKNKSIIFLDSMNWFTESLVETGKRIGIPKMQIDFDTCTDVELSKYCRNDVLIEFENFRTFIRFLEENTISRLCYTKASTAMAAYLLRHYHTPIYIHNNAEAIRLERESYKGGRCECFYLGDLGYENYYILDVNSLYPFVMRNNNYPVRYKAIQHNVSLRQFEILCSGNALIANVEIETDEPVYAIKDKRTIFPIGKFETTLCTPELKYALEHGHIKKVLDVVTYEQASIFTSYVDTMYRLRQDFKAKAVKEYEVLCKYLLNSLYGKFGQKAENWVKIGQASGEPDRVIIVLDTVNNKRYCLRFLLGEVFKLESYGEAFNSFPAISAHVTAYGRMYLYQLMQLAGTGNYFYCDTDSLIVNQEGLCNLIHLLSETDLGKLKVEERFTHLVIRGLKDYETESKKVIKGVRKNAVRLSDGIYEQQKWSSFRGLLRSGDVNTYKVETVTKHLSREYTKGIVTETGLVCPFTFV